MVSISGVDRICSIKCWTDKPTRMFTDTETVRPIVTRSNELTTFIGKTRPDRKYSSSAIKYLDSLNVRSSTDFTARILAKICNTMLTQNIDSSTLWGKQFRNWKNWCDENNLQNIKIKLTSDLWSQSEDKGQRMMQSNWQQFPENCLLSLYQLNFHELHGVVSKLIVLHRRQLQRWPSCML